jgi:hypothetical protein
LLESFYKSGLKECVYHNSDLFQFGKCNIDFMKSVVVIRAHPLLLLRVGPRTLLLLLLLLLLRPT